MRAIIPLVVLLSQTFCFSTHTEPPTDVYLSDVHDAPTQPDSVVTQGNAPDLVQRDAPVSPEQSTLPEPEGLFFARFSGKGEASTTEQFLNTKINAGTKVWQLFQNDEFVGWHSLALSSKAEEEVRNHDGIGEVGNESNIRGYMKMPRVTYNHDLPQSTTTSGLRTNLHRRQSTPPDIMQAPEITQRDGIQSYSVLLNTSTDIKKAEEFFNSKIESGTIFHSFEENGKVVGWYGLQLTADAAAIVKAHEAVQQLKESDMFYWTGALPEHTGSTLARRDDTDIYVVFADNSTSPDIQKIEEFIKSKVKQGNDIYQIEDDGKVEGWYNVELTSDSVSAVKGYEGVRSVRMEGKTTWFRALPKPDEALISSQKIKREGTWKKQNNADKALVMDSQYPGGDLSAMKDYVHIPDPGKGIYVYVIEKGIELEVINPAYEYEFLPAGGDIGQLEALETPRSRVQYAVDGPRKDSDLHSHGTEVASKAVGGKFGVAKAARVVSIKVTDAGQDAQEGVKLAIQDIISKGRQKNSVVNLSAGMIPYMTRDQLSRDLDSYVRFYRPAKRLLDLGVPFVCASGNRAEVPGEQDINALPALYQSDELPLINVGAANYDGQRWSRSQGGPYLTLYGPGVEVETMSKVEFQSQINSGTSLSAPQVAGLIATYLSHEPTAKQWEGLTGIARVKAIRDYLVSDKSSWERTSGIRMIWNGATKEDHESAGASVGQLPPPPQGPELQNKALAVIIRNTITEADNINEWLFYLTDKGTSKVCSKDKAVLTAKAPQGANVGDNPPWPGGIYELKDLNGMKCEYKNDGSNAGALWCDGRAISCSADSLKGVGEKGTKKCDFGVYDHPAVFCEW